MDEGSGADVLDASRLLDRFGGWRSVVDGGLPPAVFLLLNALSRLAGLQERALAVAAIGALATGSGIVVVRIAQGTSRRAALTGAVGVVVAAAFATWSGDARNYFLPGIGIDALYGVGFAASAAVGHPAVGYVYAALIGQARGWRHRRRVRRVMTLATWAWSGIYLVRAAAQVALYRADRAELLGLAKLALGWPLTVVAVVLTLRAIRGAHRFHCRPWQSSGTMSSHRCVERSHDGRGPVPSAGPDGDLGRGKADAASRSG